MRRDSSLQSRVGFMFAATTVFIIIMGTLISAMVALVNKKIDEKELIIGKQTITANDTVTVVRYDALRDAYELSNGLEVDENALNIIE